MILKRIKIFIVFFMLLPLCVLGQKKPTIDLGAPIRSTTNVTPKSQENTNKITKSKSVFRFEINPTKWIFQESEDKKTFFIDATDKWNIERDIEKWGHLSKEGNKLILNVDENVSTNARYGHFVIKSNTKSIKVDITQKGKQVYVPKNLDEFALSTNSLSFSSEGGIEYINVSNSHNWSVANVYSANNIMKVSKEDNRVKVICYPNTGNAREDWFTISSGEKSFKITVSQQGNQNTPVQEFIPSSPLTLSTSSLSFSSDGGHGSISVSGSSDWHLESYASSMMTVTKSGNQISVVCPRNTENSRNDWFNVVSGENKIRVNVFQYGSNNSQSGSNKSQLGTNENISLSTTSLSINSYGGTSYISVYGSINWHLESTYSSMMTVMKQGNQIKIECPLNKRSFRSDWFNVVCGDQKIKVVVYQQSVNQVSYHTFIQPVYGYSLTSQPSAGLMIGGVKRAGWYLKGRTGFFMPYGIGNIHYPDGSNDDQYFLSDEYEKTDLSLTGGLSIRFGSSPLCLNIGGGYENRMVLQKTINGDWVRNNMSSHEGVVAEGSFMFLIRRTESHRCRISISAGFSTLLIEDFMWDNPNMNYSTIELGLGVNF